MLIIGLNPISKCYSIHFPHLRSVSLTFTSSSVLADCPPLSRVSLYSVWPILRGVLVATFERRFKSFQFDLYTQWSQPHAIGESIIIGYQEHAKIVLIKKMIADKLQHQYCNSERERERGREGGYIICRDYKVMVKQQLSKLKINCCPPLLVQGSQIQNKHESECSGSISTLQSVVKILLYEQIFVKMIRFT